MVNSTLDNHINLPYTPEFMFYLFYMVCFTLLYINWSTIRFIATGQQIANLEGKKIGSAETV